MSRIIPFLVLAVGALTLPQAVAAHPHVFVDARAEMAFDSAGRLVAVRHIWQFDEAFTAFAIQGLDENGDDQLSDAELAPLAKVNVESLAEFGFFTYLTVAGDEPDLIAPTEYWLDFHGGRLTLFYTLPLAAPIAVHGEAILEVFDPEYFVEFTFAAERPAALDGSPAGCTARHRPPQELDVQTMAILSTIPADQRELPPELRAAAAVMASHILVRCP